MNAVQEMIKEIIAFGPKSTLDSIEKIQSPQSRMKNRRIFERAFHTLQVGDMRFHHVGWPQTNGEKLS